MAGSLNRVTLIGNVGKDPEIRYQPSGEAVANFSLATSTTWTDKTSNEKKENTEWHRCNAWGRLADVVGQYVKQGSKIYVEGELRTRKWEKDGVTHYTTEIRVGQMILLGSKGGGDASSTSSASRAKPAPAKAASGFDDVDDDIPF